MSLFTGIGGTAGLYSRAMQRLFNMLRGPAMVSPEIAAQVDIFGRPEFWALHGGSLMMGIVDGFAAGGVGFRSQISISNPANSKEVAILEKIWLTNGAAEILYHSLSSTPLTSPTGNLVARDTRRIVTTGGSVPSQVGIRTQNNAALANIASILGKTTTPANSTLELLPEIVIGPGWNYRMYPTADNTAIGSQVTFFVRTRPATDDELLGL